MQTVSVPVVVADNGAGDGCSRMLETGFPEVKRIGFGKNLGFGAALNRAVAGAGSGPVILLNDDTVPAPDFIESLVAARGAEMTAAVLLDERDPSRIDSAGIIADQTLMGFDFLAGESVHALDTARDPIGPTGGAAMYERDCFEQVGGFDERIFLYYEDLDLALRIRAAGGRCRLAGSARATHGYSTTLGARSARKYAMTGWSRGYLLRRYGVMSGPAIAVSTLVREAAVCSAQFLRDRTPAGLKRAPEGMAATRRAAVQATRPDPLSHDVGSQALSSEIDAARRIEPRSGN